LKDGRCGYFKVIDKIRVVEKIYKKNTLSLDVTWPYLKFEDKYGIPLYLRISEESFDDLNLIEIGDLTEICRYGDDIYFKSLEFL
jgi:hypothetical protein